MKRFYISLLILTVLASAAAAADSEDISAEVDRILRSSADGVRSIFRGLDEQTIWAAAGVSVGGEFEELEILKHIARSEGGRKIIGASCRAAIAEGDPVLQMLAYDILVEIDEADASAMLPAMYESLGDEEIVLLVGLAETALGVAPEGEDDDGAEELYALIARDLREGDKAARLKAAKLVAMMHTERAEELATTGLDNPDPEVRRWCMLSFMMSYYGPDESPHVVAAVEKALADEDPAVRAFAARQLGMMSDSDYLPRLYALLDDEDVGVRRAAAASAHSLLTYGPAAAEAPTKLLLQRLRKESDGVTRCYLGRAYGAATEDPEGAGHHLTDDGYWAFYSGEWTEKDIDTYYEEYDCGSWGG